MLSFGLVAIIGVIYSFVLVLLLWPALMAVKSIPDVLNTGETIKKIMNWIFKISIKHSKIIIAIFMAFLLASIYNADRIETDASTDMFLPEETPVKETHKIMILNSARYDPQFILIEGDVLQPEIILALDRLEENMQDNEFFKRLGSKVEFESVNTLLRNFNASDTTDLEKSYDELYESTLTADPVTKTTFADKVKLILPKNGSNYDYIIAQIWIKAENTAEIKQSYTELTEDIEQSGLKDIPGITVGMTGISFSSTQTELFVKELQIVSSVLMFVFTFLVLLLIYRNFVLSIIVSIPIFIGSVFSLGLMPLLDIPLTALNAMVISLVIGLGVDYSIYLTQRYKEELKKHDSKEAARIALERTGEANWLAAFTTSLGFLIVGFSFLPMAESFGILTGITIMLTFLTTVFLLPPLLIRFVKE
jgi:predicted RND superfamily exporter protein